MCCALQKGYKKGFGTCMKMQTCWPRLENHAKHTHIKHQYHAVSCQYHFVPLTLKLKIINKPIKVEQRLMQISHKTMQTTTWEDVQHRQRNGAGYEWKDQGEAAARRPQPHDHMARMQTDRTALRAMRRLFGKASWQFLIHSTDMHLRCSPRNLLQMFMAAWLQKSKEQNKTYKKKQKTPPWK